MDQRFRQLVESLDDSFQRLMSMEPVKITALPSKMSAAGVYLFSEEGRHLYVGRSDRLRARLQEHSRPSSPHSRAPFAFRLAREATGRTQATYDINGSRSELAKDPAFSERFREEKERVRRMEIRFVEERDPLRQALLEIYVAVALRTPYNVFETH